MNILEKVKVRYNNYYYSSDKLFICKYYAFNLIIIISEIAINNMVVRIFKLEEILYLSVSYRNLFIPLEKLL